jgi:hypothetical protein
MLAGWEHPQVDERKFITFGDHREQTTFIYNNASTHSPSNWESLSKTVDTLPDSREPHVIKLAQSLNQLQSIHLGTQDWPKDGALLDSEALTILNKPIPTHGKSISYDLRAAGYCPTNFTKQNRNITRRQVLGKRVAFLETLILHGHMCATLDTRFRPLQLIMPAQLEHYWMSLITIARINNGLVPHSPYAHMLEQSLPDPFAI